MNTIQISVIKVYVTSCMRYKLLLALQTIGHYINADMRQDQGPIMSLPLSLWVTGHCASVTSSHTDSRACNCVAYLSPTHMMFYKNEKSKEN